MKNIVVNHWLNIIKNNKDIDNTTLVKIEYGLTGLYLTLSKALIIFLIALVMNIFKEVLIFLIVFNLIRLTAFGIHAKKSWICLLVSILLFIGLPLIMLRIKIKISIKIILGIINIILILKYSPADTRKRPIINKKRRLFYKITSTISATMFLIISLLCHSNYISNCFLFALIIENIFISPITYKVFKEPYNNYLNYLKNHPILTKVSIN